MKHSKKILIVTSEFPPQPGGIGNHAFNLASQLRKYEYDVTVLTDVRSKNGKEEQKFDAQLGFKVIRIQRYSFILWTYLKRVLAYRNFLKISKPEIVLASGKFSLWLVAFGFKATNLKKAAVIHGSEVNLKIAWQHQLVNRALKKMDVVIPVSKYTKSLLGNLTLNQIEVIPNGFDHLKFEQKNREHNLKLNGSPKLVTVGTVSERKGQHHVIHHLPNLIKTYPHIHYHMVGIPSEKEKLLELATALKVEAHITFHGVLSQLNLQAVLSESDIFVILSEETNTGDVEGFGIAIIEANFMGLPVIGSKGCGIEDAIKNKYSGILIDPKNSGMFKNALDEILKNKLNYASNAKDWALKHTWDMTIKNYLKVLFGI